MDHEGAQIGAKDLYMLIRLALPYQVNYACLASLPQQQKSGKQVKLQVPAIEMYLKPQRNPHSFLTHDHTYADE